MDRGLNPGLGLALLRLVVGIVFLGHGGPKLAGGIGETAGALASAGVPASTLAAWTIGVLETAGGALVLVGLFVGPLASLLTLDVLLGSLVAALPHGFRATGTGTAWETPALLAAATLTLALAGPGRWALQDRFRKEILEA